MNSPESGSSRRPSPRHRREHIDGTTTPDGERLTLERVNDGFEVRVGRETLMSSRQRGSEEKMAELAVPSPVASARVLVGGLGMGFTLRAVLDRLAGDALVDVAELLPAVIEWNHGVLGPLAGSPLADNRVRVRQLDVQLCLAEAAARPERRYHAIALDIDNGPQAFTVRGNDAVYGREGLATLHRALRPGGVAVIWSAFRSQRFERALRNAGFDARSVTARARGDRGARHTLFVARAV